MTATLTKPLTFALAGRLVTSSKEATAILIDAIRTRKDLARAPGAQRPREVARCRTVITAQRLPTAGAAQCDPSHPVSAARPVSSPLPLILGRTQAAFFFPLPPRPEAGTRSS
ncbi:hypothetical protein GO497_21840 [Acidovorax citrulli]|nr:hypothetical protein [Paracidovorax citrulli]